MKDNYTKNLNENLLFMESIEDKKKRHECDELVFNQDITDSNIKPHIR